MSARKPWWDPHSLKQHYAKHPGGKDKECWADLVGKPEGTVTIEDYERESHVPVIDYGLHYRAKELDRTNYHPMIDSTKPLHPNSDHYVDGRMLKTIVDVADRRIRTCFHEHFARKHVTVGYGSPPADMIRYVDRLRHNVKGRMLDDVDVVDHRMTGDAGQALESLLELLSLEPLKR